MRKLCGFSNCSNVILPERPGAKIGYQINNLNREVHACQECAYKILQAPRGTWDITKHKELRPMPARPMIIT